MSDINQSLDSTESGTPAAEAIAADSNPAPKPTFFYDGTRRLRTVWRFLAFGASFFFLQFVVAVVVGLFLVAVLIASDELGGFGDSQQFEQDITLALENWLPILTAIVALPLTAITLGLVIVHRRYLDRRTVTSMGFVRRRIGASLVGGCLVGLLPIVAAAAVLTLAGGLRLNGFGFSILAGVMIPALLLLAFMEEIVFRGYLLQNLLDIHRPVFGVLLTSLVFWILHGLNPHVWSSALIPVNMFGAGVVLALAYMASGNIWFPTAVHFGWNAAQGLLLSLPVSGMKLDGLVRFHVADETPVWLTGGEFGLEASALVTIAELVLIGVLLGVVRIKNAGESTG